MRCTEDAERSSRHVQLRFLKPICVIALGSKVLSLGRKKSIKISYRYSNISFKFDLLLSPVYDTHSARFAIFFSSVTVRTRNVNKCNIPFLLIFYDPIMVFLASWLLHLNFHSLTSISVSS